MEVSQSQHLSQFHQASSDLNLAMSTMTSLIQSTPCLTADRLEHFDERCHQRRQNWRC